MVQNEYEFSLSLRRILDMQEATCADKVVETVIDNTFYCRLAFSCPFKRNSES